jgi:Flp pilus assembly protein TadD
VAVLETPSTSNKEETMLKRTLAVLSLAIAIVVWSEPARTVHGVLMTENEVALVAANDTTSADADMKSSEGNKFVRALKAPFKALGRLFRRGGKKDDNKFHRLSEKDVKKFQTAKVTKITDATMVATLPPASADATLTERLERGRTLLNTGDLDQAITEVSQMVTADPKTSEAHNLLGVAYQMKGLPDLARRSFETALKLDKNNAQILNNLGYLFYVNGEFKSALDRLKKAARLAPEDTRILNNLALAQTQLGQFDDAFKNFLKAGGEVQGRLNMANRLELAGRSEEAQKHFEDAKLAAEAQKKADPNAHAVTVLVELKNGKVTFASVPDHKPGFETYEASAINMARQLRFPKEKNGLEQVVVHVPVTPGM